MFVFVATAWSGAIAAANDEGSLEWADRADLLAACAGDPDARQQLPMWPGDRHFVPLVFDDDERAFHATMPYDADTPISWTVTRC